MVDARGAGVFERVPVVWDTAVVCEVDFAAVWGERGGVVGLSGVFSGDAFFGVFI